MRSVAVLLSVVFLVGCPGPKEDPESPGTDYCERVAATFEDCGLNEMDNGDDCSEPAEIADSDYYGDEEFREVVIAYFECYFECIIGASCEDLSEAVCAEYDYYGEDDGVFAECMEDCEPRFECDDGEEVEYAPCDGIEDCEDGSDEEGCPEPFDCGDGYEVPESWVCDGGDDCYDGEDEEGCPTFECDDGEEISAADECDVAYDCEDLSDEHPDCPNYREPFECGDDVFPWYYVCDGEADCDDESDEVGCNWFTCADGDDLDPESECDGYQDCDDGSDEHDACWYLDSCSGFGSVVTCENGFFALGEGGCVEPPFVCDDGLEEYPSYYECDGLVDCTDGSDENDCPE